MTRDNIATCGYFNSQMCNDKGRAVVGLADCYAAKVLVDNAAFLFVNSMVAFRTQAAIRSHYDSPNN